MKMFRWHGLAGFSVICFLLVASVYFFAETAVKRSIEKSATRINGAQVELQSVNIDFLQGKLELNQLQVTNKNSPLRNLFSVNSAIVDINWKKILFGQIIIDEITAIDVQTDTPRLNSGEIKQITKRTEPKKKSDSPASAKKDQIKNKFNTLPNVETLLEKEPLETVQRSQALLTSVKQTKEQWQSIEKQLPTTKTIDDYQRQLDALLNQDIKDPKDLESTITKLGQIQDNLKQQKKAIKEARSFIETNQNHLKEQLKGVTSAPEEDWKRLSSKYKLDQSGALNLTELILGDNVTGYLRHALDWYHRLSPLLNQPKQVKEEAKHARGTGRYIHFKIENAYPDFLISKASASFKNESRQLLLSARDITHQQNVLNRPTSIHVKTQKADQFGNLDLTALLDHRHGTTNDQVNFILTDTMITKKALLRNDDLTITLQNATVQTEGKVNIVDNVLSASIQSSLSETHFDGQGQNTFSKEVLQVLSQVNEFTFDALASGPVTKDSLPKLSIKSDLDNQLTQAFKERIKTRQKQWQEELKTAIQSKANASIDNPNLRALFADDLATLGKKESSINDLLNQAITKQESAAKNKLDQKKAEEQQRLENKLDKKKDEKEEKLKEQLNDKLKGLF